MEKSFIQQSTLIDTILTEKIIQSASVQHRQNYYSFPKHIHNTSEIYQILDGNCRMDIGKETIDCKKNDFIIVLPNIAHSFYLNQKENCSFRHIHFFSNVYAGFSVEKLLGYPMDFLSTLSFCCNSFFHTEADTRISSLTESIVSTFRKDSTIASAYSNLHLTELLLYIIEQSGKDLSSFTLKHSEQDKYVAFTLDYIQKNYASKIQIEEIARKLNISGRYLSKIFLSHMNMTILNYINTYRMNQAIDLIANTELSMTKISEKIGMNDSQHFSKLFKNTIGSSPSQYRKILKDENFYT